MSDVVFLPGHSADESYSVCSYIVALEAQGGPAIEAQSRCAGHAAEGEVHGSGGEVLNEQVFAGGISYQHLAGGESGCAGDFGQRYTCRRSAERDRHTAAACLEPRGRSRAAHGIQVGEHHSFLGIHTILVKDGELVGVGVGGSIASQCHHGISRCLVVRGAQARRCKVVDDLPERGIHDEEKARLRDRDACNRDSAGRRVEGVEIGNLLHIFLH